MSAAALAGALAVDALLGEPPDRVHPVAWIGRALGGLRRALGGRSPALLLAGGGLGVALLALGVGTLALGVERACAELGAAGVAIEALVLSAAFAGRALLTEVGAVRARLAAGDLHGARQRVARLVSRDTRALDAGQVGSAAVETLAENLTDSFVAPLMAYAVAGLPGAWVYRVVNTADAMLGYREGELEHLGKVAARADDALNFLPARIAGLALVIAAPLVGASPRGALASLRRDRRRTASPNGGWTMAATAGALGVRLEKPGAHVLGDGPAPDPAALALAMRLVGCAGALAACGALLVT